MKTKGTFLREIYPQDFNGHLPKYDTKNLYGVVLFYARGNINWLLYYGFMRDLYTKLYGL